MNAKENGNPCDDYSVETQSYEDKIKRIQMRLNELYSNIQEIEGKGYDMEYKKYLLQKTSLHIELAKLNMMLAQAEHERGLNGQ